MIRGIQNILVFQKTRTKQLYLQLKIHQKNQKKCHKLYQYRLVKCGKLKAKFIRTLSPFGGGGKMIEQRINEIDKILPVPHPEGENFSETIMSNQKLLN